MPSGKNQRDRLQSGKNKSTNSGDQYSGHQDVLHKSDAVVKAEIQQG